MNKKILPLLLALCVGSCGIAMAKSASSEFPDITIAYQKHILPNGLTLIIHEDHKAPIVAVNIWYHVGSKDERPGRTGFAHLFEHLMFNGSQHYNDDYFKALEPVGATKMNGTTWLDRTNFFENVPTSALDRTLWLESDRMGYLLGGIDQKKLDEQRGVVQNEKRQGENQPYGKVDEVIATNTYPAGHPYSWTTIGSIQDLDAATLSDVRDWFKTWYGAANATLVIAGDVNPAEVLSKVEKYFGNIPSGPLLTHRQVWIAKMHGERRMLMQDHVPQARLYQVWNVPGVTSPDFTLLDIASDVLAGGKNSRLYKRLVYDDQIATDVSASLAPLEIGSQFQITVSARAGVSMDKIKAAVHQEMARFLKDGPSGEELYRTRVSDYADFVRSTERIDGYSGTSAILARSQVYGGSPDFYQQSLTQLRNATRNTVRDAARRWLSDGDFVLDVEPAPDHSVAKTGADRTTLPDTGTPPSLKLPPLQRTTLANGLKVALAERHDSPVVQMNLIVNAGYAADSLTTPGTANLTLAMMDEGTKTRSALEIAARAEELGADISLGSTLDTSYFSLNALSNRLPDSLALFSDILLNPTFPEKELARLKPQMLAAIKREQASPYGIASRIYPKLIYGAGHAYANPMSGSGTAASVEAMTTEQLRAFYQLWVRPDNATLLVVGDISMAQLKPLLEQQFNNWRAPSTPLPKKNLAQVALPTQPRVFLINRPGSEQSLIFAAELAPPRNDPAHIAMVTLNTTLGGNFVSRMNMNLREDKHWAYGAYTRMANTKGQSPFIAYAPVQSDKTAEAMQEALKELKAILHTKKPSAAEIQYAKNSIVLSLPGENETTSDIAGSYSNVLSYDLPDNYYNELVGHVEALTAAQLDAAAARLIHPEALTWVVVGDLSKIEAPVRKLGFGKVTVLDTAGHIVSGD